MTEPHDDVIETLLRQQFDGPVADDGFSERVMQRLPPRRHHVAWLVWAGVLVGAGASWLSLLFSPLLRTGWHDWMRGELSTSAVTLLVAIIGMSLLACGWSLSESEDA